MRQRLLALGVSLFLSATAEAQPITLVGFTFDAGEQAFADDAFLVSGSGVRYTCLAGGIAASSIAEALSGSEITQCVNVSGGGDGIVEVQFTDNSIVNYPGTDLVIFEVSGPKEPGTPDPTERFEVSVFDGASFSAFIAFDPVATCFTTPEPTLDLFTVEIDLSLFGITPGATVDRVRLHLFDNNFGSKGADITALGALNSLALVPTPTPTATPIVTLTATPTPMPAAASDGPVVGWGRDDFPYFQARPPDAVNGISGTATDIAAGDYHSCAIQTGTGNVVCWGRNDYGQVTPPDEVNGVSGTATYITAGFEHSCAIQAGTGDVVCWGRNDDGQVTPPDEVNGVSGTASAIAAGDYHSCAIQAGSSEVVCWGSDYYGEATPPDEVNGVSGTASAIAAGGMHSCAIQAGTGDVVCWGYDLEGQATSTCAVNGVWGTATDIAAGGGHSCAVQAGTGKVVCWGANAGGQARPPNAVNGISGTATAIAAGSGHSCAIQADTGNAVCWGFDYYRFGYLTPPDEVNGVSGTASAIAAGDYHSLAIVSVPEPGQMAVLLTGIGLLLLIGHPRQRNQKLLDRRVCACEYGKCQNTR